jgi:hypothetical protein
MFEHITSAACEFENWLRLSLKKLKFSVGKAKKILLRKSKVSLKTCQTMLN